jgi:recombination protein RecR
MTIYIESVEKLINEFRKLPGIGPKSAKRIVFFLLKFGEKDIVKFSKLLVEMKSKVKFCKYCFNISENEICHICNDENRDKKMICLVEEVSDVVVIEDTGEYKGLYHVLGGLLSPIENIGPDEIKINELKKRVKNNNIEEIIIALSPTVEGESTATYIKKILEPFGVKVTRLASGLPVGGDLEYADEITLGRAISDRREF